MTRLFNNAEIVAILSSVSLALLMLFVGPFQSVALPASAMLALAMVVWITVKDISDFVIPDGPLICMAAIGAAARLADTDIEMPAEALSVALDALVCGGALLAIRELYYRLRGVDGIGFGDVKLAAVGGMLVGMIGFFWALFLASAAGIIVVLIAQVINPRRRLDRLPFGALLAPVCWGLWMLGILGVT